MCSLCTCLLFLFFFYLLIYLLIHFMHTYSAALTVGSGWVFFFLFFFFSCCALFVLIKLKKTLKKSIKKKTKPNTLKAAGRQVSVSTVKCALHQHELRGCCGRKKLLIRCDTLKLDESLLLITWTNKTYNHQPEDWVLGAGGYSKHTLIG